MNIIRTAAALAGAITTLASAPGVAATLQVVSGTQRSFGLGSFGGVAGQSFTSVDTSLNSIGFQFTGLNPTFAGAAYTLTLVAGESLTGTALITRTFSVPNSITTRTPVWYDIDIGSTAVTAGQRYTAVLTSSDTRNGVALGPDYNIYTGVPLSGDAYAFGRAIFATSPYPNCTDDATSNCDLNFRVTGTTAAAAVPEPATWALMIGGFGLTGGALRRRRTTHAFA